MASVEVLLQLSLFPVVFSLPPAAQNLVEPSYGKACVGCMAAADGIRVSQNVEVRCLATTPCH